MHCASLFTTQLRDFFVKTINFRGNGSGTHQNTLAHLGQLYAARRARENRNAQIIFGLAQCLRHRGLRFAKRLGCAAQTAVFGNRDKDLDVLHLHGDKQIKYVALFQVYS